ncbi:hypothetical protein [Terracidiphilus gabretensis]|jgi:hypothetical protein|uniref:hypothetical protein n=1 Tax=Terracidiphilus gabretensis TaxID=1577687 RepID=UPI00071B8417|nr:hypothetical protein [Terracidiphilus gabretensis]
MLIKCFYPLSHRLTRLLVASSLLPALIGVPCASADPVPVRHVSGAIHGFLELRSEDGHIVASGDTTRVVSGDRITSRTVFTFKDGSIDDETTIYSQHRTLQLISDHRIQKGPYFPHPLDTLINARTGQVTVRTTDKDGKEDTKTDQMKLPPELVNGLIPVIFENVKSDATDLTFPMVVFAPKPRIVRLFISKIGEDDTSVAGHPRKANHYNIKIDIGGIAGVIAPMVGKAPPDIQVWTIGGVATTLVREIGPLYAEGPMMTIQLASPSWPEESKPAH